MGNYKVFGFSKDKRFGNKENSFGIDNSSSTRYILVQTMFTRQLSKPNLDEHCPGSQEFTLFNIHLQLTYSAFGSAAQQQLALAINNEKHSTYFNLFLLLK